MGYVVIHYFTDLKDKNHPYNEGDTFPREGVSVSEERLFELSTDRNKQKKPLIRFVEEKVDVAYDAPKYTKTDINRMPVAELKELALANGVDGAEDMSGAELKKEIISIMGL